MRRKLVHRRLVLLTSQRLALSIESNTPEFELIKAALAAKHGIRRIARELQTGVGTVVADQKRTSRRLVAPAPTLPGTDPFAK
jgi:hypothetical protein